MKIHFDQLSGDVRELVIDASEQYGFTIGWFMEFVNMCNADVRQTAINAMNADEPAGE